MGPMIEEKELFKVGETYKTSNNYVAEIMYTKEGKLCGHVTTESKNEVGRRAEPGWFEPGVWNYDGSPDLSGIGYLLPKNFQALEELVRNFEDFYTLNKKFVKKNIFVLKNNNSAKLKKAKKLMDESFDLIRECVSLNEEKPKND